MIAAPQDTIAAIVTPPGEGALAVLRVSGPQALSVADRVFQSRDGALPSSALTHTVHYGHIIRGDRRLDEVLLTVLRAPRSYTREPTVEISCHGGLLVSRLVLETLFEAGARMAEPGEFTKRAFLNGRLDLAQAEAVADLIHARTELALDAAHRQLEGGLSQALLTLRDALLHSLAHVEAHLDFPEEDIAPDTQQALLGKLEEVLQRMQELLATASEGRILRHGFRTVLVGRPNVGKSSLMNQLLGHERAIVSPIAGTTRDTVEDLVNIDGVPVLMVDTAGLRITLDPVEAEGVRRGEAAMRDAELVLFVIDGSEPLHDEERVQLARLSERAHLILLNKCDRPLRSQLPPGTPGLRVSGITGEGLPELRQAIAAQIWTGKRKWTPSSIAINARHADALRRSVESTERAREALQVEAGLELAAFELRIALQAAGEIVGETTTDDLLDSIFSQFCLGK